MSLLPEQIAEAASRLHRAIWDIRHSREESDFGRLLPGGNPYKPFYGALSVLMVPVQSLRDELLGGVCVTLEEAKAICSASDPRFKDAIKRDPNHFEMVYEFLYEAWE